MEATNEYIVFVDGKIESRDIIETPEDYDYFLSKSLIEIVSNTQIKPKFVGEIITPHRKYICLPKNFEKNQSNIELTKKLLKFYSEIRDPKTGNILLLNKIFDTKSSASFQSDEYYFQNLKKYFLDYITYGFIYPLEKKVIHNSFPPKGGKLDIIQTSINRKRDPLKMTYQVIDKSNDKNWNIDDIYYHTIIELMNRVNVPIKDQERIKQMKLTLDEEGFQISERLEDCLSDTTPENILKELLKYDLNIIHYPIREILVNYYKKKKLGESLYNLKIFYTQNFNLIWEELCRDALFHNEEFREEKKYILNKRSRETKWVKSSEIRNFVEELPRESDPQIDGNMISYSISGEIRPDIFSRFNDRGKILSFIGDAKYYKNYSDIKEKFRKELHEYNIAFNNSYPMCVFLCSEYTTCLRFEDIEEGNLFELLVFQVSCEDVVNTAINNKQALKSNRLIRTIHNLIKKYSTKKGPDFAGGF
jgi:hypothetical protein